MKLMRIRRMGNERVLAVPKALAQMVAAEYMSVSMDEAGRLIYTPVNGWSMKNEMPRGSRHCLRAGGSPESHKRSLPI